VWPFRLPLRNGMDLLGRRRGHVLERLVHVDELPVHVRIAQPTPTRVVFSALADSRPAGETAIARMRFALGVDDDLRDFQRRFRGDPLIGRSLAARPWLRVPRRPEPFEALAWAICEQLIEFVDAAAIQRRIVLVLGRRCPRTWLRDAPTADRVAGVGPATLESFGLAHRRAVTLRRCAREVARGRIDLRSGDHQRTLRRLAAIPGIGPWTLAMVGLGALGRYDMVPAGDVNLLKLAGRVLAGGDPDGFATEAQVGALLAPYGEWAGLAALHLMTAPQLACPDDRPLPYRARVSARLPVAGGAPPALGSERPSKLSL
jgi:3-methyladenine DNA glycosylase/8-oxoguanine DNA glycosylase